MMRNKHLAIKYSIIAATTLSLSVSAREHHDTVKDYTFSAQELNVLSKASQPLLSDDQFVFNNDLALLDWDSIFASYFPHLQPYQETFMHYAGYYSINPKLLISLIESKSSLVTNPSKNSYNSPFGDLSNEKGFEAQINVFMLIESYLYILKKKILFYEITNCLALQLQLPLPVFYRLLASRKLLKTVHINQRPKAKH